MKEKAVSFEGPSYKGINSFPGGVAVKYKGGMDPGQALAPVHPGGTRPQQAA